MRSAGFIGPSYELQSVNADCQRTVNLYPEINALGTGKEREIASLVPTPGLRRLVTASSDGCRGFYTASNGDVFTVIGDKFYKLSSAWVLTEFGSLGTDSGRVSMADNGLQVVMVDGQAGYVYTIASGILSTISDPDFLGANHVRYLDGYFIFDEPDSNQWYISGLNDTTFDALDIATAEASPDEIVNIEINNHNVFVFGTQTIEVYYNSGDADFPFVRINGAVIDVGCSAPSTLCKMAGALFFLGGDANGSGIVYMMQGYQAVRISTPAIEKVIRGLTPEQIEAATAHTYQQGGHLFYCLNLPGTETTFVYDVSTSFWHDRTYLNLWSQERHRAECSTVAYGTLIVGDYENGKIYQLDPDYYFDDTTPIVRERIAPHTSSGLKLVRHNSFQLDMETGVGLDGTGQGTDPVASIRWSDNGGHSWSNWHEADIGTIGNFGTRVIWRRLGVSRDRVYHVRITDPIKVVILGAEVSLEEGAA